MKDFRYFFLYKPFGMLSQFSAETENQVTLKNLDFNFPSDVYPVGRLDADSEGLLLLTNNGLLKHRLLNPKFAHYRTYYVQIEGCIDANAVNSLQNGVSIKVDAKQYNTMPAKVKIIEPPLNLPIRVPPIRYRKNIPTSWIEIKLKEGKNRQVRKMTAVTGFPTLRLVRVAIENLQLSSFKPNHVYELTYEQILKQLNFK